MVYWNNASGRPAGRCVAQSLVWCGLHNATRSCSTELKNRGNDRHRRAGDRPGSKRASPQTPSLTYLTSLDCKTTMRGDIHKSSTLLPPMDFHRRVSPISRPLHPRIPVYPVPLIAVQLNFRFNFLSSRLRCSTERLSAGTAADLLRVCKLELKELSTSGNPREIYRRARFHE